MLRVIGRYLVCVLSFLENVLNRLVLQWFAKNFQLFTIGRAFLTKSVLTAILRKLNSQSNLAPKQFNFKVDLKFELFTKYCI